MQRIDNTGAVASLPTPLTAGTPGYFGRGNPATGTKATPFTADFANMLQEELMAVVLAANLTPSKTTFTQLRDAIAALYFAKAGGTLTGALNEALGAAIASSATVNLTTATGNLVHITGTTTITAITLAQGARHRVVFDGVLTLTNGASLLLPGAANITTAAGDAAEFVGDAAGVVRCVSFVRADGSQTKAFGSIKTLSGAATLDATYAGQLTVLSGTTYTATLPAASTYPAGAALSFFSGTSGTVTLTRTGTDTIAVNSSTVTSLSLGNGDTLTLVSDGVSGWRALGGSAQLPYSSSKLALATAQSTASGTAVDFTGIPSWAKRVTVMLNGVSTNGVSSVQLQAGSGSIQTTGYNGTVVGNQTATVASNLTSGFLQESLSDQSAATVRYGSFVLENMGSNNWICRGQFGRSNTNYANYVAGGVTLSGSLDRVRLTTVNGTDAFDAGSVNIMWE